MTGDPGPPVPAAYPGRCPRCRELIEADERIVRVPEGGGWAHWRCPR